MEENPTVHLTMTQSLVIKDEQAGKIFLNKNKINNDKFIVMNPLRYIFKHYVTGGTPSVMLRNGDALRYADGRRYSEDAILFWEYAFNYKCVAVYIPLVAHFKSLYGEGGLTSHMWEIFKGELENYRILREKGYYGFGVYYCVALFAFLKFFRRKLICWIR